MPARRELPDAIQDEAGQVPPGPPGVAPGNDNLPREGEIVADERTGADDEAGGEGLVVAVAQPQDPGIILVVSPIGYLQEPEVTVSFPCQRVLFGNDPEVVAVERLL